MQRSASLAALLLSLMVACVQVGGSPGPDVEQRFEWSRPAMGTTFRIVMHAFDEATAVAAADAAFARIDALESLLSDYDEASELSRLGARSDTEPGVPVPVGDDLWRVLQAAQAMSLRTHGAFDVTVGPWVALWRRARRQAVPPEDKLIEELATSVGFDKLSFDPNSQSVTLSATGMRLDLGGIAKGYALDEALAVLRRHGIDRALVDGGGDVAVGAPPPGRSGWRVAIEPFDGEGTLGPVVVELYHAALATSGDSYQALQHGGQRHGHILDPRSGRALTTGYGTSVLAADGMTADALASAACVLGPGSALQLVEGWDGVELRMVGSDESGAARVWMSSGFAALCATRAEPPRN